MAENDTSGRKMDSQEAQRRIAELSGRYGLRPEESDINTFANKNPEDQGSYMSALEEQMRKRAAPTSNRQYDSQSGVYANVGSDPRTSNQPQYAGSAGSGQSGGAITSWLGQPPAASAAPQGPDPAVAAAIAEQTKMMSEMRVAEQARQAAIAARELEEKTKRDALYTQLQGRAQQSQQIDPNDPIIKNQVDIFRANQERAWRNLKSDAAESGDPLGATRERMAAERTGQATGGFQAELMARELMSRRAEIADALTSMGGILDANQVAGLQRELASMDNSIKQYQLGQGDRDIDLRRELGVGQLSLAGRGLDLDALRTELMNRQFYADLGLRNRGLESENDRFSAQLGFNASDRARYWDALSRGMLD